MPRTTRLLHALRPRVRRASQKMAVPVNFLLRLHHLAWIKIALDALLTLMAAGWAWFICYSQVKSTMPNPLPFMIVALLVRSFIGYFSRFQNSSWLHVSRHEAMELVFNTFIGTFVIGLAFWILPPPFTLNGLVRPEYIFLTEPAFHIVMLGGARITVRAFFRDTSLADALHRPSILIVGAQDRAHALAYHIEETHEYEIVGFVDNDPNLQNRSIRGTPVLGTVADVPYIIEKNQVDEIIIAISPLPPEYLRELMRLFQPTGVPVRILPPLKDLLLNGHQAHDMRIRDVQMEDLLSRPEVKTDSSAINDYLQGRTVLVTGGGGSIGGELCRQVLAHNPSCLLVLGRGENSVFEIVQELNELNERADAASVSKCEIIPIICDVRDREALENIFARYSPQVVFHAAAHKHVPLMEQYPSEAVKNNVLGTLNVVELAAEYSVSNFVMVSTDKAVDPSSVMGASKRLGELIVRGYAEATQMNMVSVRFGNVLGSRGSVVPTMQRQIRNRQPITITDPDMVRYFMTIPEASSLILQAGAVGGRGEIFILDMGRPLRILDLAHDLIRLSGLVPDQDVPIRIIGKRPGEKMREEILNHHETQTANKKGPFFMAPPISVELESLLGRIECLRASICAKEHRQTVLMLKSLVPEFTPDERWDVSADTSPILMPLIPETTSLPENHPAS